VPSFADQLWEAAGAPLLDEINGVSVAYSRGLRTVTVTAVPSVIDYDAYNADDGAITTIGTLRQYVIATAVLVLDGETVTPKPRDRITETINGEQQIFEVSAIEGKPAAELQVGGYRWLIRCKRVE